MTDNEWYKLTLPSLNRCADQISIYVKADGSMLSDDGWTLWDVAQASNNPKHLHKQADHIAKQYGAHVNDNGEITMPITDDNSYNQFEQCVTKISQLT